jgi:hypothetical protein
MNMHPASHSLRGNALLTGLLVIMVAGAMVVASTESFISRTKSSSQVKRQTVALSAVEAVLARRERAVIDLASSGDPAEFVRWQNNYGVDFVGDCEVRWKIEPVRTPPVDGTNTPIEFISNPSPDLSWTPSAEGTKDGLGRDMLWTPNEYIYLFRVAAEARLVNEGEDKPLSRAQGVRYVSINNQPLFRWVIFYAAQGPKGDLELSHGSNLSILGNVHSNGAIYLGSGPNPNHWGALQPNIGYTEIGPFSGTWPAWASGQVYPLGARVSFGGRKYRSITNHTASAANQPAPAISTTWLLQWQPWTAATAYVIGDRVENNGELYKCTSPHTSSAAGGPTEPGAGAAWRSTWESVLQARVSGVDGVARLSKQTMFGAIGGLPVVSAPAAFSADAAYEMEVKPGGMAVVGEPRIAGDPAAHYLPPTGASNALAATYGGVVINPNRVLSASGLQTSTASPYPDDRVDVNGTPILGLDDANSTPKLAANDSRDIGRTPPWKETYKKAAPEGFSGMVRQVDTGGRVTVLPRSIEVRPMEAQALQYPTNTWTSGQTYSATLTRDGALWADKKTEAPTTTASDPQAVVVNHRGQWWACTTTHVAGASNEPGLGATWADNWRPLSGDPHAYARPLFLQPDRTTGTNVVLDPDSNYVGVEVPGQYQRHALGAKGLYPKRRTDHTGWDIVGATGTTAGASQPANVGLTIRERPVPDTTLKSNTVQVPLTSDEALPYAYGKHTRPGIWPFTAADVTSTALIINNSSTTNSRGSLADFQSSASISAQIPTEFGRNNAWLHIDKSLSSNSYALGGSVDLTAACNPGDNFPAGWYDQNALMQRHPHWYAENWRFIQMAQQQPVTEASGSKGLTETWFNDAYYTTAEPTAGPRWAGPFGGSPVFTRTGFPPASNSFSYSFAFSERPVPGVGTSWFSVRWEGFLRPTTTDKYIFRTNATWGMRVWIEDTCVIDDWRATFAAANSPNSAVVSLVGGLNVPITVEWYTRDAAPATVLPSPPNLPTPLICKLEWRTSSQTDTDFVPIPDANLRPVINDSGSTARKLNALDWSTFKGVQVRLDTLTGNPLQKVGLMLRGGAGTPRLHSGRDAYAFLGYSPTRGVFAQVRGEAAVLGKATGPSVFIGDGYHDLNGNGIVDAGESVVDGAGEMAGEDLNNDRLLGATEDANGNGHLDDPATITRSARLIPYGPFDAQRGALIQRKTVADAAATNPTPPAAEVQYLPSTAGVSTWGRTSVHNNYSGLLACINNGTNKISNPDIAVAEGTVDAIYIGPLSLGVRARSRARVQQPISRQWYWFLDPDSVPDPDARLFVSADPSGLHDGSTRRLRFYRSGQPNADNPLWTDSFLGSLTNPATSDNYPGFFTKDPGWVPWWSMVTANNYGDLSTDWSGFGFLSPPPTVNTLNATHYPDGVNEETMGLAVTTTLKGATTGSGAATRRTTSGFGLGRSGSFDTNNVAWGDWVTPAATTVATSQQFLYLTTPYDTRPKAMQGATVKEYISLAATKAYLEATRGGTWTAVTSLSAPTPPATTDWAGYPANTTPDPPQSYPQVTFVRPTVTEPNVAVGATTINVEWTDDFRPGETYQIDTGANAELITVTGVDPAARQITVVRGVSGAGFAVGAAKAHAAYSTIVDPRAGELELQIFDPASNTLTLKAGHTLRNGDIIRVNHELMRVLADPVGNVVTVERGAKVTTAVGHAVNSIVRRTVPRSFGLARSRTFAFELHSYTSTYGSVNTGTNIGWYWTNQPQYRPWSPAMPASVVPPRTGGFQPSVWYPTSASATPYTTGAVTPVLSVQPTAYTTTSVAAVPSTGATKGYLQGNAGTALPTSDIRFTGDQPLTLTSVPQIDPFGTDKVWLRIERGTGADINKLLFKYGTDGSTWTSLNGADGTPMQFDASYWFKPPVSTNRAAPLGITSSVAVFDATGFNIGDLVSISDNSDDPTKYELAVVTGISGNTLTMSRGQLGTTALSTGLKVQQIPQRYLGPDMQIGLAIQGGPRYWTTVTAGAAQINPAVLGQTYSQTWTVDSIQGMAVGDILQVGNESREQVRITSLFPTTKQIAVSRTYDHMKSNGSWGNPALPGYAAGTGLSSVTQLPANRTTLQASNLKIYTANADPYDEITYADWELAAANAKEMSKYLASQYQVFFGTYDITEDFFSYNETDAAQRTATEEWIFNRREFWSQSRWWGHDTSVEKDSDLLAAGGNNNGTSHDEIGVRQWLGKTTLLSLNVRAVQDYLKARTVQQAVADVIAGGSPAAPVTATADTRKLSEVFNGLFYLVRTNRYPANPTPGLSNPYNPDLPNGIGGTDMTGLDSAASLAPTLQPYGSLQQDPAFEPEDFHHAVRLYRASSIDWGFPASGTPDFGASKTSFVTPSQLFVQGDLNTTTRAVTYQQSLGGGTPQKITPTAIMADMVTFLSNAWSDASARKPGLVVGDASASAQPASTWRVLSGGSLAQSQGDSITSMPKATSTGYFASILTHNIPTTRRTALVGECAAFISTMLYQEDWVDTDMRFLGSLVVFDSRRYSRAYLLDSPKNYGRSPFGWFANGTSKANDWGDLYKTEFKLPLVKAGANYVWDWGGTIGAVQGPPRRIMDFNYDLLTEAGTPPFTPFGVTASGVGAWSKVIE